MMKQKKRLLTLFLSTLRISACTFGGGFVIIPLLRKEFVEKLKWLEEKEMLDLTAIAQSSPGAIAVNASVAVGYRVAGVLGAFFATIGTVLPPLIIISVVSVFYKVFRDNPIVNVVMAGMLAGVAAVILDVVINMIRGLIKGKRMLPLFVLIGAFVGVHFWNVNIITIILCCGIVGAADVFICQKRK